MSPQQPAKQTTETNIQALYFPRGLPGLERYRWFEVEQVPGNRFFVLLQSREEAAVGMILLDPFPMFPEYRCRLTGPDLEDLELNSRQEPLIYTTVSVRGSGLFTNLAAPVAINAARRKGKQVYLPEYSHQLRVPLALQRVPSPLVGEG